MSSEQGQKLFIKTHLLVVFFLILDIAPDSGNVGLTDAESGVALLPSKLVSQLIHPL